MVLTLGLCVEEYVYVFYFQAVKHLEAGEYRLVAMKSDMIPMSPELGKYYPLSVLKALADNGHEVVILPRTRAHYLEPGRVFGPAGTIEMRYAKGYCGPKSVVLNETGIECFITASDLARAKPPCQEDAPNPANGFIDGFKSDLASECHLIPSIGPLPPQASISASEKSQDELEPLPEMMRKEMRAALDGVHEIIKNPKFIAVLTEAGYQLNEEELERMEAETYTFTLRSYERSQVIPDTGGHPESLEEWQRATAGKFEAPKPYANGTLVPPSGTMLSPVPAGKAFERKTVMVPPHPTEYERWRAAEEVRFRRANFWRSPTDYFFTKMWFSIKRFFLEPNEDAFPER